MPHSECRTSSRHGPPVGPNVTSESRPTVASKYGASREIGDAVAAGLGERELGAMVHAPADVDALDGYDAVVLGSGVYAGHWLRPATVS